MEADPIQSSYFYSNDAEKTKLNWFCYEYAYALYSTIRESAALKKFCRQKGQKSITEFCVHFSKAMKQSVYDRLEGRTDAVIVDEDYVQAFYPRNTLKETKRIIKAAMTAWEEHMDICVVCPTRCLSEKEKNCDMFDRLEKGEFLI